MHGRKQGFSLWEWLLVLVVAAGFVTVLVSGARRAPVVDKARQMKNELEEIDRVLREQESLGNRPLDNSWDPGDYLPLVRKKFTRMKTEGVDPFGHPYESVPWDGHRPPVPAATARELEGLIDPPFWNPFPLPDDGS